MVVLENAGVNVPRLILNVARLALPDAARVTVIEYVLVVDPSCAVTATLITFAPTFKLIGDELVPDVTVVPFTFTVAFPSLVVGFTVAVVTVLATADV